MPLGFRGRDLLATVREAQGAASSINPIVVIGPHAEEFARDLRAGSKDGRALQVGGGREHAAALVVVLAGSPGAAELAALRAANRQGTPVVVVQTDLRERVSLPYVVATDIVDCRPGQGFPIAEIAAALAERLGHDGVALASQLPLLRDAVCADLVRTAARRAALVGILPWPKTAHFPPMALLQTRLVLDLASAYGQAIDAERAPELAAVAGTGLGLRALVRRLPRRVPLVGGVTGYLGTRAIGEAALRRYAGDSTKSVRPGT